MGHKGIPAVPVDGEKYSSVGLLGLPLVLEYDEATGGFKLVIDVENTLEVSFTGVSLTLGASVDTELPAAALLVDDTANPTVPSIGALGMAFDGTTWDRIGIDTTRRLMTSALITGTVAGIASAVGITGTVDTELPAATAAADFVTPAASPAVQGFGYVYDQSNDLWLRMRSVRDADQGIVRNITGSVAATGFTRFWEGNVAGWEKALMDTSKRLMVSALVTGSVTVAGTVALSSQLISAQYAEDSLHVSGETGTFVLGVRQDNPLALASEGDYTPLTTDALGRLHTFTSGSFVSLSSDIQIGAVEIKDADTDNRQRVTADGRAWVNALTTGTVDIARLAPLADGTSPSATGIHAVSHLMGYNEDDNKWERLRANPAISSISPILASPALITFGITAGLQLSDNTIYPMPATQSGGLFTDMISGSFPANTLNFDPQLRLYTSAFVTGTVDTELPAAVALADNMANPTAPAVASHLMGYDGVTWDRLYMGASGSLAVDLITALNKTTDEVTAYVTGSVGFVAGSSLALNQRADVSIASPIASLMLDSYAPTSVPTGVAVAAHLERFIPGANLYERLVFGPRVDLTVAGNQVLDSSTSGTANLVGAFLMARGGVSDNVVRRLAAIADSDDTNLGTTYHLQTLAALYGYDHLGARWDRAHINPQGHIYVDAMVSGTVGFVAGSSVALNQPADNRIVSPVGVGGASIDPTATGILAQSRLYAFDSGAGQWGRVERGVSGSIGVDLFSQLERTQDEVTAYITGTAQISRIIERADVAIASPVGPGSVDDIAPTTTGVLTRSMTLVYDDVGENWDRWRGNSVRGGRVDLISGSFPWKNMIRAAVTISGTAVGEATVVAAVPGQRIHVMEVMLITDAATQVTWKDGSGGSFLSGPAALPNAGDGYFLHSPENPDHYHFRTSANTALILLRTANTLLGGHIHYFLEP